MGDSLGTDILPKPCQHMPYGEVTPPSSKLSSQPLGMVDATAKQLGSLSPECCGSSQTDREGEET